MFLPLQAFLGACMGIALACHGGQFGRAHLGAVSVDYADYCGRKSPTPVILLLFGKNTPASRLLNGVRCLPAKLLPGSSILRSTGEEANHAAFRVNKGVGGSARD